MSEKLLYFDCETTGLNEYIHEPHQIAVIVEIDNEVKCEEVFYTQPINWNKIDEKALNISNKRIEDLKKYPEPRVTFIKFNNLLSKYVDRYDREDKFTAVGQNVRFDMNMLNQWYMKLGNKYFYSLVGSRNEYDILSITKFLTSIDVLPILENNKLVTVCKYLGVDLSQAHDALCDIQATRTIFLKYREIMKKLAESVNREGFSLIKSINT